jgi:hypothetical protein
MVRGATIVLTLALVLGLSEAGARWLAPGLERPQEWYDSTAEIKAKQMDTISDGGAEIVFVGTSMMRDAADPERLLLAGIPATSAYNAALSNGSPLVMERWIRDHVVRRLEPEVVVWGLASFQLHDQAPSNVESYDRYLAAPRSSRSLSDRLEAFADSHSSLFRYQTALRSPSAIRAAFSAVRAGAEPDAVPLEIPGEITRLGRTSTRDDLSVLEADTDAQAEVLRTRTFVDFEVGDQQLAALQRSVKWLHGRDIEVIFVVMPTSPFYTPLHPRGLADEADALEAIVDTAAELDVPVVRADQVITSVESFADILHLNRHGVELFTELMSSELSRIIEGGST